VTVTKDRVVVATVDEIDRLVAPIVLAFSTDPFVRWLLSDPAAYSTTFPQIVRIHAQRVVRHGSSHRSTDFRGASLWYPPAVHPDSAAIGAVFSQAVDDVRLEQVRSLLVEMDSFHPGEPHMYLRMIGVDPALQGRGYGSELVAAGLVECDRRGLLAYLEATSPGSRRLYERHGFAVTGELQVADSPPIWPMVRPVGGSSS
jgi:ribosomal protein S18 acetylase RimI-like enzyme